LRDIIHSSKQLGKEKEIIVNRNQLTPLRKTCSVWMQAMMFWQHRRKE